MVSALITVAVIAWCAQLALGGWQISRFNRAFDTLCQQGRVGVGRSSGRFKPRVVVAIALDDQQRIVDTLFMKGLTVFARPQKIPAITGMHVGDLQPDVIFPHDPLSQNALSLALNQVITPMKPRQRQAAILEYLQKQGKCSVEELAQYFDTTGTTIRKDLVILEHAGTVIRTYGGVVLNKEESDPPIDHKTLINTHKKELIAEAAVGFIHDGDSIILDAGSTVLQMVPLLSRFNNITVMTNSLHIVNALSELDNEQTILMPGGTFRKKSASFHGQLAENAFEHFTFDKLFMGTDGIDLNAGVTTFNEVYTVSKAMCNAAREVILMADSSKFGRKSPNVVCSLESVDKLITDAGIDPAFRQALEEKGIDVIITGESNE